MPGLGVSPAIDVDLPCRKCQYNLRGLTKDGMCPECGSAVALSIRGDFIRHSDPAWIRKISLGASWVFWATILLCVVGLFEVWNNDQNTFSFLVPRFLLFGQDLFAAAGVWLLTTPDPGGSGESDYGLSRKIARASIFFQITQQLWNVILFHSQFSPGLNLTVSILNCGAGLAGWIGFTVRLQYLSKLARRIRDHLVVEQARNLRNLLGTAIGVRISTQCVLTLTDAMGIRTARLPIALYGVGALAGLCIIVCGIFYLLMLSRLAGRLREQYALAKRSWITSHNPAPDLIHGQPRA